MKTTLLIMAAGIGSRFGTGIKQLEPVDDAGHIIMDYSIHDAIEAGFNHVVFIIRKDIEKEFKEVIGDRIASICSSHNVTVDYPVNQTASVPYAVRVSINDLNIRKGPGTNYGKTGYYTGKGVFTIVAESAGTGSVKGWGKLKSGAGWIALDFAARI